MKVRFLQILFYLMLCAAVGCASSGGENDADRGGASDDNADDNDDIDDDSFDDDIELPSSCPEGMAGIPGGPVTVVYYGDRWGGYDEEQVTIEPFCMDIYEASQPDATETSQGSWSSGVTPIPAAESREGVLPWSNTEFEYAAQACANVGKRLPTLAEWQAAFSGPANLPWPWGSDWVDQGCYAETEMGVYPTGGCCIPVCQGEYCHTLCDMVGNVSEFIDGLWDEECYGDEQILIAGGPSHYDHETMNGQDVDPLAPGCWTFTRYSLSRSGLHNHNRMTGFEDDGFRCAYTPD